MTSLLCFLSIRINYQVIFLASSKNWIYSEERRKKNIFHFSFFLLPFHGSFVTQTLSFQLNLDIDIVIVFHLWWWWWLRCIINVIVDSISFFISLFQGNSIQSDISLNRYHRCLCYYLITIYSFNYFIVIHWFTWIVTIINIL